MYKRLRSLWVLGGAALLALLLSACVQIAPVVIPRLRGGTATVDVSTDPKLRPTIEANDPQMTISPPAGGVPSQVGGRQVVAVQRGIITDQLALNGHVAGADETPLTFASPIRVDSVNVKPGDAVDVGQLLVQADAKQQTRDLAAARSRLETSTVRLAQGEAQAQARQRELQASLVRAQAELERVRAGASPSERRGAEAAVAGSRASLDRAQADLNRATADADPLAVRTAQQDVESSRLALQRAETDLARALSGPAPSDVRAAERDVASAQAGYVRAKAELDRVSRGADPDQVRAAQRDVERTRNDLRALQATKIDKTSRAAQEAAIANAQLRLQDVQDRLALVQAGPKPWEVDVARRNLEVAQAQLDAAQDRSVTVRNGPDPATVDSLRAAVGSATVGLENAQARLDQLQGGPSVDQVSGARNAVASARAELASAMSRLTEVNGHPTPAELRDAKERVATAQAAFESARVDGDGSAEQMESAAYDLVLLRKTVDEDRAQVQALEQEIADGRLLAPTAAVVSAVSVRSGDPVEAGQAVVTLAQAGDPIVRLDLSSDEVLRLATGQRATVQLDAGGAASLDATVIAITPTATGATAQLRVAWPEKLPSFGTAASARVIVQQKDDVLLIPQKAIRSAGTRRFVEYLDDGTRKVTDVQVGLGSDDNAEILSGLRDGQSVLVGP